MRSRARYATLVHDTASRHGDGQRDGKVEKHDDSTGGIALVGTSRKCKCYKKHIARGKRFASPPNCGRFCDLSRKVIGKEQNSSQKEREVARVTEMKFGGENSRAGSNNIFGLTDRRILGDLVGRVKGNSPVLGEKPK